MRQQLKSSILAAVLVGAVGCVGPAAPPVEALDERGALRSVRLDTMDGVGRGWDEMDRAQAFFFVRTDCPIANRYAPEMQRLYEEHGRDVEMWLVYIDADQSNGEIAKHRDSFGLEIPALRDDRHALVELTGSSVTPSAAVFDDRGTLVYEGRIDDRFVAFGKTRLRPKERDVQDTLAALRRGDEVPFRKTQAVGCFIADLAPDASEPDENDET